MTQPGAAGSSSSGNGEYDWSALGGLRAEGREPGARRKKLAGYLKAANELRQSYRESYGSQWANRDPGSKEVDDGTPGAFPDAAVVRNGSEEMILFPSYARKHVKNKPKAIPGTIQEAPGTGRDVRDSAGAGDAEFWKQEWEKYEDDNAIVDVDVRGWVYAPHKGQMTRKNRLFVGIARQLVGVPAPRSTKTPSPLSSAANSRSSSPNGSHRERVDARTARHEEELASQEAEAILRKGEAEAAIAGRGGYSEVPKNDTDSLYSIPSRSNSPAPRSRENSETSGIPRVLTNSSQQSDEDLGISAVRKRASWAQPGKMSAAELAVANSHLMARLKPFLANPLANTPISAFFYNDSVSRQRTINTNSSGHFSVRAALDFVPTHVRILASEKLSATEEVIITDPNGVSLISDIDDTIKHSAIGSGAREIFRNAFIRDLGDLTIEGVREWYTRMANMGVKIHYVSNSPWQLYPVLTSFFAMAGLPPGSFHLKQYSGMLQGIFEPVAERKKSTLDKIMRDFPERRFILVGDSGEADLEVYTDVVLDNPGRILGVFIRDVTTPVPKHFFDSSMGALSGDRSMKPSSQNGSTHNLNNAKRFSMPPEDEDEDDPDVKAAIAASLRDFEMQNQDRLRDVQKQNKNYAASLPSSRVASRGVEKRPELPHRRDTEPPAPEAQNMESEVGDLIDFEDESTAWQSISSPVSRATTDTDDGTSEERGAPSPMITRKPLPPARPSKPQGLRSASSEQLPTGHAPPSPLKSPPPKPRKPSTSIHRPLPIDPSPLSQVQRQDTAAPAPLPRSTPLAHAADERPGYRSAVRQKLSSAYNALPSTSTLHWSSTNANSNNHNSLNDSPHSTDSVRAPSDRANPSYELHDPPPRRPQAAKPLPPPPPPRNVSSYSAAAAKLASRGVSSVLGSTSTSSSSTTTNSNHPSNSTSNPDDPATQKHDYINPQSSNGNFIGAAPQLDKKVELWKRRWARAASVMEEKGVLLRSWRVGKDVEDVAVGLVERAVREGAGGTMEKAEERGRGRGREEK
ncbi:hypothetical protein B0A49_01583 [Cryomyces minteri]|uniref:Phosphatidate phosphatase APP1 catalytic domain-containing protein n=1 Tax=Cryomyces minteri TaxID=331657 RepID=A0A4V6WL51_9PEZI|nr:hypothetical protein B0A49_05264 [Cryomyces minteri]TKA74741.1 hypothetical protein B0A49_03675 [Cryomyces minteri]TKA75169.1 hypothetical protein B0A49_02953 [Cryomyces minteri]TKA80292.1 hypothetical protein B0A49_01583 [Cryomyces minteri]